MRVYTLGNKPRRFTAAYGKIQELRTTSTPANDATCTGVDWSSTVALPMPMR